MWPITILVGAAILIEGIQQGISETSVNPKPQQSLPNSDFTSLFPSNRELLLSVLEEIEAEDRKGARS